jgi:nucleotide-binding universal stress UspA family protein
MLQRILAPTDGSPESEKALPLAEQIAFAQGAEVILAFIIDQPALSVGRASGAVTAEEEAAAHLATIEGRLKTAGVRARSVVERGPTAATLLDREKAEQPDLLVIATHGRTGLARFALGSVADRMVREGTTPVLLVRRSTEPSNRLQSAMVLLDGSSFGQGALAMAGQLAGKPLRSIKLFRAVADPAARGSAETYLQGAARKLDAMGLEVTTLVDTGDTRHVIERAAKGHDIVILSTHGRGGFDRLRHGSVADYLVRYLDQPVLLVRAKDIPEHTPGSKPERTAAEVIETTLF